MLQSQKRSPVKLEYLSLALIVLPALLFYTTLFRTVIDLPFADDYNILEFLNGIRALHGTHSRLLYLLAAQHNEYKLIFGHSIVAVQYILLHHVSFTGLCVIGDFAIALLAFVLWEMFLKEQDNQILRLALFVPVSWLLFQLSYAETLNWAEPGLQNLYVFTFSFAAFALLPRKGKLNFVGALVFLTLAIAASGNGFITALAGLIILMQQREFIKLFCWCCLTGLGMWIYAFHYHKLHASPSPGVPLSGLPRLFGRILYTVSFLGSVGQMAHNLFHPIPPFAGSVALGATLICAFGYLAFRGKLSANPSVNAAILFIFVTSLAVAGIRADLGIAQSVSSRYRIYSCCLLILLWYLVCEHWLQKTSKPLRLCWIYRTGFAFAVFFSLSYDVTGYRFLRMRNTVTIEGMSDYEHPSYPGATEGPIFTGPPHVIYFDSAANWKARQTLALSKANGIYTPPLY